MHHGIGVRVGYGIGELRCPEGHLLGIGPDMARQRTSGCTLGHDPVPIILGVPDSHNGDDVGVFTQASQSAGFRSSMLCEPSAIHLDNDLASAPPIEPGEEPGMVGDHQGSVGYVIPRQRNSGPLRPDIRTDHDHSPLLSRTVE